MNFRIISSTGMTLEAGDIPCETPDGTETHLRQLVDAWERMLAAEVELGVVEQPGAVEVDVFEGEPRDEV